MSAAAVAEIFQGDNPGLGLLVIGPKHGHKLSSGIGGSSVATNMPVPVTVVSVNLRTLFSTCHERQRYPVFPLTYRTDCTKRAVLSCNPMWLGHDCCQRVWVGVGNINKSLMVYWPCGY